MNSGFRFPWAVLAFCMFAALSSIHRAGAEDLAPFVGPDVEKYNVIWDSPSESSFGSMPLGNGDIGLNVWVETNGHLLFYIAKVDALDSKQLGPKLGRVRLRMEPPLPLDKSFRQTLSLIDASVLVEAGDVQLRVWVDANHPVIRLEAKSQTPRTAIVTMESLRPLLPATVPLPEKGTVGVVFNGKEDRLAWCYRNLSSDWWAENFRTQNTPEIVAKTRDPLLHRTSGCLLQGKGFVRELSQFGELQRTLRLREKATAFDCSVKVISTQPDNLKDWLHEAAKPSPSDWKAHCAYWKSFWNRSYVHVTSARKGTFNLDQCRYTQFPQGSKGYAGHKEIDAEKNVFQISQRYALERFCEACASRGAVPPNANGSLFTMDMPAGVMGGYNRISESPISPDYRYWQECCWFMWQNLRFPYWSMASRRPTGSDPVAAASLRARERTAWSTSRRLSFLTGSPISCRRHGSTGTGITGCLRRLTRSGPPSRRSRSATSASGKRPRRTGSRVTGTAREAAATRLTHIKSPAHMTRRGLPGPSSWRGWGRSFRSSARTAAGTFG